MRTIRCYHPESISHDSILLSKEASHHLANVLRLKIGTNIEIFDNSGQCFLATITALGKQISINLIEKLISQSESPCHIHLAQTVSKGDKMDWVIQKAVELGVHAITPIISKHCDVRLNNERWEKKCAHWQGIIIAACEQSGRTRLPILHSPIALSDFINTSLEGEKFIFHPIGQIFEKLSVENSKQNMIALIGPEGGFSNQEISAAQKKNWQVCSLGPRILRTETAPLVVLTLLQKWYGDL